MRSCLICKIPVRRALCDYCVAGLVRHRDIHLRGDDPFQVCALLAWREVGPPAIPWLVRSLKRHQESVLWEQLTALMLQIFGPLRASVLIPVPSLHALGFARALSAMSGVPVREALMAQPHRVQKRLRRHERQDLVFLRREEDLCTKYTNVIVCDDVITTGATARAAFRALDRPSSSEVWCLVDRRPCGAGAALL